MNILKDINNNPLTIGKCYKNIGQYIKRNVDIKHDTYLGKLNRITYNGIYKTYTFKNNYNFDEYFIEKNKTTFKEVSCDDLHSELPRYDSNRQLSRASSLTEPPEYESPRKYEPPPSYVKKTFGNTLSNTFGNTLNTLTRLTRGKSPPYTETGGKKKKKKNRKTRKSKTSRKRYTTRKRITTKKH